MSRLAVPGEAAAAVLLRWQIDRAAPDPSPCLVVGETGTGKELVAAELHRLSGRSGPLVTLNCAALSPQLVESQLFGHARGAFTHAFEAQSGRIERANGGTLVLDHVEDLALSIQAKLLRAIEDGTIQRLGEGASRPVDVRFVATSRGSLKEAIALGTFRDDLYHRLSVITIPIPPLRERTEDILPLATAFLASERRRGKTLASGFSAAAGQMLSAYSWPGNARELQSAIERAVLKHDGDGPLEASSLPKHMLSADTVLRSFRSEQPTLKELERVYILWVLEHSAGTKADAAKTLGISRKSLWEKCKRFGIA